MDILDSTGLFLSFPGTSSYMRPSTSGCTDDGGMPTTAIKACCEQSSWLQENCIVYGTNSGPRLWCYYFYNASWRTTQA
jgi:hypothetical protein